MFTDKNKKLLFRVIDFTTALIVFSSGIGVGLYITGNDEKIPNAHMPENNQITLEEYAKDILVKCSTESHRPTCYDEEIPKLMDFISFEDAFVVVSLIQEKDDGYWYCHVLGHKLAARETAKDPSLWKDVISRAPTGICSNGSIHGAFQERFRTQSLGGDQYEEFLLEAGDVCEKRPTWNPTSLEQATCYHALGHLAMYATNGDIHRSVDACDLLSLKDNERRDYRRLCYDGAFMQIFQPLEPEDFALIEGKQPAKEEVEEFCSQFSDLQKPSCLSEAWPLFREGLKNQQGIESFCSLQRKINDEEYSRCYRGMFYVAAAIHGLDTIRISEYCSKIKDEFMFECFKMSITRMVDTDYKLTSRAVELCEAMRSQDLIAGNIEKCYEHLLNEISINFHKGSDKFNTACKSLPKKFLETCLNE